MERLPFQLYVDLGTHLGGGWKLDRSYEDRETAEERLAMLKEAGMTAVLLDNGRKVCG